MRASRRSSRESYLDGLHFEVWVCGLLFVCGRVLYCFVELLSDEENRGSRRWEEEGLYKKRRLLVQLGPPSLLPFTTSPFHQGNHPKPV